MLDKTYYFKIGSKDVQFAIPRGTLSRILTTLWAGLFVFDLFTGNFFGMVLSAIFFLFMTTNIR